MSDVLADEKDLRSEYPVSFRDVEEIVQAHGTEVVRMILDQIEREAEGG